jgi:hypothetical protein
MVTTTLPAPGYALDPGDRRADRRPLPGHDPPADAVHEHHRRAGPGARRALLGYTCSCRSGGSWPTRSTRRAGDQFLFNLLISPVAIVVNFVALAAGRDPGPLAGRLHSRVPATILIAIGGFLASGGDTSTGSASSNYFQVGKLLGVCSSSSPASSSRSRRSARSGSRSRRSS